MDVGGLLSNKWTVLMINLYYMYNLMWIFVWLKKRAINEIVYSSWIFLLQEYADVSFCIYFTSIYYL